MKKRVADLTVHPISKTFPPLPDVDYTKLRASIEAEGVLMPLDVVGAQVIDGAHRLKACTELGIEIVPVIEQEFANDGDMADHVCDRQKARRQMSKDAWAVVKVEMKPYYAERARQRKSEGGSCGGKIAGRGRSKGSDRDRGKSSPIPIESEGRWREEAAADGGVNSKYIQELDTLKTHAPELYTAVKQGKKTRTQAAREYRRKKDAGAKKPAPPKGKYRCIVIDPPWDVGDEGDVNQMGRANPDYATMPIAKIKALPVADLADTNCHLYLWITNRSLYKGFALLKAWGFRHITMLTWCKPSIGVGNYFRNNTEHVLFGVKGKLALKRHDVGTWFKAKRGKRHSEKPAEFLELVESCSPGPRLEMFSRNPRKGWKAWGNL